MTEKDCSLLRPFDLDAAKGGVKMCDRFNLKQTCTYVAGPDSSGWIATKNENGNFICSTETNLFMLPICWVEGKPVYPGDVLEHPQLGEVVAKGQGESQRLIEVEKYDILALEYLAWPRPKPVKRWINIYPAAYRGTLTTTLFLSEQDAISCMCEGCTDRIEIELPPLPAK